jgi:transcriptional regulator with XRE-family HTH domain
MNADTLVGERVHAAMWHKRMTQKQLASVLGVGQSAVARKIRGERGWSLDEVLAVARVLDVPVTDLLPDSSYVPVLGDSKGILSQTG